MSFFHFLGNVAHGNSAPGGGVFGFLRNQILPPDQQLHQNVQKEATGLRQFAQGTAAGPAQIAASVGQAVGHPIDTSPRNTPVGNFIFGNQTLPTIQGGFSQNRQAGHGLPFSFLAAGLTAAGDVPFVPGGKAAGLTANLAKTSTAKEAETILVKGGMNAGIAKQVAPAIAKTQDPHIIQNIIDKAHSPAPTIEDINRARTPVQPPAPPAGQGSFEVGATSFRGTPVGTIDETKSYFTSKEGTDFQKTIHQAPSQHNVSLRGVDHSAGVWEGQLEPSFHIKVAGHEDNVSAYAAHLGKKGDQDAVIAFKPGEGSSTKYSFEGLSDPQAAVKQLQEHGISGATVANDKLIVYDLDNSLKSNIMDLSKTLGVRPTETAGTGKLIERNQYDTVLQSGPGRVGDNNPANIQSPAARQVAEALQGAQTQRTKLEALYTQERSQRLGSSQAAGAELKGLEGHRAELAALRGELKKINYPGLSEHLTQAQQDALFTKLREQVKASPTVQGYAKLNTNEALRKIIYGDERPPQQNEINLLQSAFGEDFAKVVKQDIVEHGQRQNALQQAGQIFGVPRAIMASADLSASLRQGIAISTRHPFAAAKAFRDEFKTVFNEQNYQDVHNEIINDPHYALSQSGKTKLAIQDVGRAGVQAGESEEQFASNLAEKIPGLGKIIHASNRAYVSFLNSIRFNVFKNLAQRAEDAGVDFSTPEGQKIVSDISEVINTSSGRGNLGKLEKHAGALSTALFAPRLIASRVQMLNPHYYTKLDPIARREALTTVVAMGAFFGTVLSLAKLGGASVSTDPTSADFGKIKVGDTRFDIMGGYQQYLRLGAQLAENKITNSVTGGEVRLGEGINPTRLDVLSRFLQGKESPVLSFGTTILKGKDISGNNILTPKGVSEQLLQRFTPLITQDFHDLLTHKQGAGAGAIVPAIFGVGVQSYGNQDLPVTSKQKTYLQDLQSQGASKEQIAANKSFFQVLKGGPSRTAGMDAVHKAIDAGDYDKAAQLAQDYNAKLENYVDKSGWGDKYGQWASPDLEKLYNSQKINLTPQSVKQYIKSKGGL